VLGEDQVAVVVGRVLWQIVARLVKLEAAEEAKAGVALDTPIMLAPLPRRVLLVKVEV